MFTIERYFAKIQKCQAAADSKRINFGSMSSRSGSENILALWSPASVHLDMADLGHCWA